MGRIILGVIVGFVAWSILWVGGDEALATLSPDWYGAHKMAFERTVFNQTPFGANSSILILNLVRAAVTSLISGYLAVLVANERIWTTWVLGFLLLAVGIYFESSFWHQLPPWYHLIFLAVLIPLTIAGGKLRRSD